VTRLTTSTLLFESGTAAFGQKPNVHFLKPKTGFPTLTLQRIFANLMADEYCNGDFIIPVKWDSRFLRPVSQRDVLWAYKPIVRHQAAASSLSQEKKSKLTALVIGADSPYFVPIGSSFNNNKKESYIVFVDLNCLLE
jgi:hypothetical protein